MKKLLAFVIFWFSTNAFAGFVVATVNGEPITRYEFDTRKSMAITLNNIDISNPIIERKLNDDILNILLRERLISQHLKHIKITDQEVDYAISKIENNNRMLAGGLTEYLKKKKVDISAFKSQIAGEIRASKIMQSLSGKTSVPQSEIDAIATNSGDDIDVDAWVFKARSNDRAEMIKMYSLRKKLRDCDQVSVDQYQEFADGDRILSKLKDLSPVLQSSILDMKTGSKSTIFKNDDQLQFIFLCKKTLISTAQNEKLIKMSLFNKKTSQSFEKLMRDLEYKSDIQIYNE